MRLEHQTSCGTREIAIWAIDHPQIDGVLEMLPALLQLSRMLAVDNEVNGDHIVSVEAPAVSQRLYFGEVDT